MKMTNYYDEVFCDYCGRECGPDPQGPNLLTTHDGEEICHACAIAEIKSLEDNHIKVVNKKDKEIKELNTSLERSEKYIKDLERINTQLHDQLRGPDPEAIHWNR